MRPDLHASDFTRPVHIKLTSCAMTVAFSLGAMLPGSAAAKHGAPAMHEPEASVAPGTLVRWSAPETESCGMKGRSWPALHGSCYYPIDLLTKAGPFKVTRIAAGHSESARIIVEPNDYPTQEVELGAIPQAKPSRADMKRAKREEAEVNKIWVRKEGPARFTLPLEAPANPLHAARDFGSKRIFNDTPAGQPHMGADYTIDLGTPIRAVADGTVVLAEDQFFAGNGVYIDHGDGLVSEYFHLSKIEVKPGQEVRRGETIGLVGSTGRSSGAHLFFGVRWHDARINPQLLLESPGKIAALGVDAAEATPSGKPD